MGNDAFFPTLRRKNNVFRALWRSSAIIMLDSRAVKRTNRTLFKPDYPVKPGADACCFMRLSQSLLANHTDGSSISQVLPADRCYNTRRRTTKNPAASFRWCEEAEADLLCAPRSRLVPSRPSALGSPPRWPRRRRRSVPRPRSPPGPPCVWQPGCALTSLACLYG